jgi:hypothetical protein
LLAMVKTLFFSCVLLSSLAGFSQKVPQWLGSPNGLVETRGDFYVTGAFGLPIKDTTFTPYFAAPSVLPRPGVMVINPNDWKIYVYDTVGVNHWVEVGSGSVTPGWSLTGNAGLSESTNFLGTTDGSPLLFRFNNIRAGRIDNGSNVFFGKAAGPASVPLITDDIFDNVAIGASALSSMTAAGDNTAVGSGALMALTAGENNVAIGKVTLSDLTTGSFNTAFGVQSGGGITTGSRNTILGGNITGLPSNLSDNIIIGTGLGTIRQQFDASGNLNIALQGLVSLDTTTYKIQVQDASGNVKRSYWPTAGSTTFAGLTDVNLTSPANGEYLKFDGTDWVNVAAPTLQTVTTAGATTSVNLTLNGTGTALTATAGSIGAILTGSSVGAVLTGTSFGAEAKSPNSPLLVTNTATGTGILPVLHLQRNATYTGANNDGLYIRFDAKNDAGTSKNYAVLNAYMPSAANGAEYGGFSFDVMNNGAGVASAWKVTARGMELYNGTAPTTSVTDGIRLYSEDVAASAELKVRDEAGNITTLSPHNFTGIPQGRSNPLAWSFYSEKEGKYINADMAAALQTIEQQSAEIEELKEMVSILMGKKYQKKAPVRLIYTGDVTTKPNPANR